MTPLKTKALFTFIFCFCFFYTNAQSWQWAKNPFDSSGNWVNSSVADAYGNVYVTGVAVRAPFSLDTISQMFNATWYCFLIKYDSSGNVRWRKKIGGNRNAGGYTVAADGQGNVYVWGVYDRTNLTDGNFHYNNTDSSTGGFLLKYDSAGNFIWVKDICCGSASLNVDINNNIYLTGDGSYGDMRISKHDPLGKLIWKRFVANSIAYATTIDPLGHVYVVGDFNVDVNFDTVTLKIDSISRSHFNVYIVKYDSSGHALWARKGFTKNIGPGNEYGGCHITSAKTDNAGNVYIGGHFERSTITFGTQTIDNFGVLSKMFLVKYNSNGNEIWAKSASGGDNEVTAVTTGRSGNIYVTGKFAMPVTFDDITISKFSDDTASNLFLAKYNENGEIQWVKSNCSNSIYPMTINTDFSENVYIAGNFAGKVTLFGSSMLINNTPEYVGENIFLAKFNNTLPESYAENDVCQKLFPRTDNGILVYPNPAEKTLTIVGNDTITSISINNAMGQIMNTTTHNSNKVEMDISDLPNGLYFIRINGSIVRKFSKL